jgi:ATP-dependent protease HslVU (ClpYQ) peptidase subunit
MSCVVGIKHKGNVYIGADTRGSSEGGDIRPIKAQKIFRVGNYLLGAVGSARGCQILHSKFFDPPEDILDFPDYLRNHCREKGCLAITDDQTEAWVSNLIIGYKKQLYEILVDFHISTVDEFTAIGSGGTYALGSLKAIQELNNDMEPVKRIELALKCAMEFDSSTGGSIVIEKL